MRLMLADDDRRLGHLLRDGLRAQGHEVETVHDGVAALERALHGEFDALVLDVMMPGLSGFEVVRELRAQALQVPVLLLTARDSVQDRVDGLDSGADDYLVKPFAFDELTARLRALSRRAGPQSDELHCGDVALDRLRHEVRRGDEVVELSHTEYRLLEFLLTNPGRILTREQLLHRIWGDEREFDENVVAVYMHYLRRKLGTSWGLRTIRSVGYRVDPPGE